jgi:hypothetical protein
MKLRRVLIGRCLRECGNAPKVQECRLLTQGGHSVLP